MISHHFAALDSASLPELGSELTMSIQCPDTPLLRYHTSFLASSTCALVKLPSITIPPQDTGPRGLVGCSGWSLVVGWISGSRRWRHGVRNPRPSVRDQGIPSRWTW